MNFSCKTENSDFYNKLHETKKDYAQNVYLSFGQVEQWYG